MNKIKQLAAMIFMACGVMMSMASCGKENSEENSADIVGTWQLTKDVLYFDGEQVDVDDIEDDYVFQCKFKDDGTVIEYDDGDIDSKAEYVYSPESKTLTFFGDGEQMQYRVDRLTSSELILSEDLSILGNILDYDRIGDVVDTYLGVKIHMYPGSYIRYCYKKNGKYCPCEPFEMGGGDNKYYDKETFYFKRVK